ncbi:hypothetical protein COS31_03230 [Candidatus Roizmanbacteria bacterium CG02_land_8_20_14_3_00_36_15]|uniref:Uncharacterized protein n=2 Tax=Candidatus Roizmaniibacteriota TaxID=1752723 RepID=A0A2M8KLJ0_9BACT|nr:MAG: hypothetical protein COS51_03560 [Candidatus Roizmanbacteria bacterium CG03_land_8_20_14_0_80_36_21]PIV37689.1 MAG: hypothetical protein COS31_03230 [Candidatus Roizmanbacteria bacterium CG02_land_8_20_14_3_00_36_15]PIY69646.1 MAG: hypothetical protein COY89_05235 [Candidatus Roizmanbacteria bacterium CG_4_10_14_0_8_um_filter_36_36]PJA53518.1 MAG: hypothetical protein CO166_01440 [Candidatus Roizmanbacteria bacterium CG_4_9_14_3_um_filter_36_11]PJC82156.1 MAG: hypothetical protein CO007
MDLGQLINNQGLLGFFFKSFTLVFSVIYLLYAVVIYKQTQVMDKTLTTGGGKLIVFISFLQIILSFFIILLAIGFI